MATATQTLSERFDPKMLAALEGLDFKARYVMEGFLSGLHDSPFHRPERRQDALRLGRPVLGEERAAQHDKGDEESQDSELELGQDAEHRQRRGNLATVLLQLP